MARIKLLLPSSLLYTTQIPVRITDINYGNHVGNDAFVGIIHEARIKWLQSNNYSELNIEGIGLIMSSITVEFKNESFYNDVITIDIFCGELSRAGFELYYQLQTNRNGQQVLLAIAKTDMVCYNYGNKKVESIPANFKKVLA
ncbi:MAG: acyl-CoA thioesterase [Chitinophagaceae bacterium]|nr:acyl-CoA thioesterase [Chitinophagaceae bacterium]